MKAVVYRNRRRNVAVFVLFIAMAILTPATAIFSGVPEIVLPFLFIMIYLALRVPLAVFAESAESVSVEVITEVRVEALEVFRKLLIHSKIFTASILLPLFILVVTLLHAPHYAVLPANLLLLVAIITVLRNRELKICRQGVVDGGSALIPWNEFSGFEKSDGTLILHRRFNFPVVLPEREDAVSAVREFLGKGAGG